MFGTLAFVKEVMYSGPILFIIHCEVHELKKFLDLVGTTFRGQGSLEGKEA